MRNNTVILFLALLLTGLASNYQTVTRTFLSEVADPNNQEEILLASADYNQRTYATGRRIFKR